MRAARAPQLERCLSVKEELVLQQRYEECLRRTRVLSCSVQRPQHRTHHQRRYHACHDNLCRCENLLLVLLVATFSSPSFMALAYTTATDPSTIVGVAVLRTAIYTRKCCVEPNEAMA